MSRDSGSESRRETSYLAVCMSLGLVLGGALGIVYGTITDNVTFMTIAIGGGLVIGLSIGTALEARKKDKGL
jgi:hypothetical protein